MRKKSITQRQARIASAKAEKDMRLFFNSNISPTNDNVTIVIKSHLYIESILEDITKCTFVSPKHLDRLSFQKRLDILIGYGAIDNQMYKKLCGLNKIRNKYAHNFKYKLKNRDLEILLDVKKTSQPVKKKLIKEIGFIIGYISATRTMWQKIPFVMDTVARRNLFVRDSKYINNRDLKKILNSEDLNLFLENLKLPIE